MDVIFYYSMSFLPYVLVECTLCTFTVLLHYLDGAAFILCVVCCTVCLTLGLRNKKTFYFYGTGYILYSHFLNYVLNIFFSQCLINRLS